MKPENKKQNSNFQQKVDSQGEAKTVGLSAPAMSRKEAEKLFDDLKNKSENEL